MNLAEPHLPACDTQLALVCTYCKAVTTLFLEICLNKLGTGNGPKILIHRIMFTDSPVMQRNIFVFEVLVCFLRKGLHNPDGIEPFCLQRGGQFVINNTLKGTTTEQESSFSWKIAVIFFAKATRCLRTTGSVQCVG